MPSGSVTSQNSHSPAGGCRGNQGRARERVCALSHSADRAGEEGLHCGKQLERSGFPSDEINSSMLIRSLSQNSGIVRNIFLMVKFCGNAVCEGICLAHSADHRL